MNNTIGRIRAGGLLIIFIAIFSLYLSTQWLTNLSFEKYFYICLLIYSAGIPIFVSILSGQVKSSYMGLAFLAIFLISFNLILGGSDIGGASMIQIPILVIGFLASIIGVGIGLVIFRSRN